MAISSRMRFSVSGEGFSLGAAQEGIVAGDQFAFERAVAEHLAEDQGLRQVIVQVRVESGFCAMAFSKTAMAWSYSRL